VLGQRRDLVAVLHRVGDELDHVEHVRVPQHLQLHGRDIEFVFRAVLDPHAHQRVQAQIDQRHLARQILGLVTHRLGDDRRQAILDTLSALRIPTAADGFVVVIVDDGRGLVDRRRRRGRQRRSRAARGHHGIGHRHESTFGLRMHLNRRAARMRGQGGGVSRCGSTASAVFEPGQHDIRQHRCGRRRHQRLQIGCGRGVDLPRRGDHPAAPHASPAPCPCPRRKPDSR
jgi:hypothetical protein